MRGATERRLREIRASKDSQIAGCPNVIATWLAKRVLIAVDRGSTGSGDDRETSVTPPPGPTLEPVRVMRLR